MTNFTYRIANVDELVTMLADALGEPPARVREWIAEVEEDTAFLEDAARAAAAQARPRSEPLFGRRLGWYCVVRHARPELTVETGSHDGLGTSLLLHALERNAAEGAEGRLVSVDIDPASGWLVPARLAGRLERLIGTHGSCCRPPWPTGA